MVNTRQFGDESLERAQLSRDIDGRRVELALEASQDLAVQAAPIDLRTRLEPGVKLWGYVLERQVEHFAPFRHRFGSNYPAVDQIASQEVILPWTGRLIDAHIGRERIDRAASRTGPRSDVV